MKILSLHFDFVFFFRFIFLRGHILHMVHSCRPIYSLSLSIKSVAHIFLHKFYLYKLTAIALECTICTYTLVHCTILSERPIYCGSNLLWLIYRSFNRFHGFSKYIRTVDVDVIYLHRDQKAEEKKIPKIGWFITFHFFHCTIVIEFFSSIKSIILKKKRKFSLF